MRWPVALSELPREHKATVLGFNLSASRSAKRVARSTRDGTGRFSPLPTTTRRTFPGSPWSSACMTEPSCGWQHRAQTQSPYTSRDWNRKRWALLPMGAKSQFTGMIVTSVRAPRTRLSKSRSWSTPTFLNKCLTRSCVAWRCRQKSGCTALLLFLKTLETWRAEH